MNAGRLLFQGNERDHTMKNLKFFGMRLFALVFIVLFSFGLAACTGGEGGEGGEGVMFVSDGQSRPTLEFPMLDVDESFAGLKEGMEIAIYYDSANEVFEGRLRNEAPEPVCDISVSISADGSTVGQPHLVKGLASVSSGSEGSEGSEGGGNEGGGEGGGEHGGGGEGGNEGGGEGSGEGGSGSAQDRSGPFSIPVAAGFSEWQVTVDSHGCSSAPSGSGGGEGSEGGESGGGGEGGSEGGGEGGGGESGDESSPPTPKADRSMGTANGQDYDFSFNGSRGVFEGTVEPTSAAICGSKTEIHVCPDFDMTAMMCNAGVIELGPTIPQDLQPGGTIYIVMYTDRAFETYSLHPEAGTCP